MTNELPKAIADYVAAANAFDADATAACFYGEAVVHDEGREHRGRDAIRAWKRETDEKYHPKTEVLKVANKGPGRVLVTARVSGTFPSVELRFAFTLAGDKIASLRIG